MLEKGSSTYIKSYALFEQASLSIRTHIIRKNSQRLLSSLAWLPGLVYFVDESQTTKGLYIGHALCVHGLTVAPILASATCRGPYHSFIDFPYVRP